MAVSAVTTAITRCPHLSCGISSNDKTPSWDGNICVHKNATKDKQGLNKVAVQVKGKECVSFNPDSISYSAEVEDLRNYLHNGGVLFFIVELDPEDNTKIFYETLLPVKLQLMLDEIDEESEFFIGLERGVKNILMALLASIFSCSAVPIIPTKYMDTGKAGMKDKNRAYINTLGETIIIPKNALDIFGYLDVNPCSNEGKFYYSVEGGDKYCQKVKRTEIISHEGHTVSVPVCDKFSELYLSFGEGRI